MITSWLLPVHWCVLDSSLMDLIIEVGMGWVGFIFFLNSPSSSDWINENTTSSPCDCDSSIYNNTSLGLGPHDCSRTYESPPWDHPGFPGRWLATTYSKNTSKEDPHLAPWTHLSNAQANSKGLGYAPGVNVHGQCSRTQSDETIHHFK